MIIKYQNYKFIKNFIIYKIYILRDLIIYEFFRSGKIIERALIELNVILKNIVLNSEAFIKSYIFIFITN